MTTPRMKPLDEFISGRIDEEMRLEQRVTQLEASSAQAHSAGQTTQWVQVQRELFEVERAKDEVKKLLHDLRSGTYGPYERPAVPPGSDLVAVRAHYRRRPQRRDRATLDMDLAHELGSVPPEGALGGGMAGGGGGGGLSRRIANLSAQFGRARQVNLDLDKAAKRLLLTLTALGGAAAATTIKFTQYGHELLNAANASRLTVDELSSLATGFSDLVGIRTRADDLVAFERAQRAVVAGIRFGVKPTRDQVLAYSRLGLSIGDTIELNEQLYNSIRGLSLAERERVAGILGISPAIVAAANDQLTWNEIQQAGITYTEDEARALRQTDRELAKVKRSLEAVGKELAIQFGPILEVVGGYLAGLAEHAGALVANFQAWLPWIGGLAGALVGLTVVLKLAAIAQAALAIASVVGAPFGVAALAVLGIGAAATALGVGVGVAAADKIGKDIERLERELADQKLTEAEVRQANVDALREAQNDTPIADRRDLRALTRTYRDEPARQVGDRASDTIVSMPPAAAPPRTPSVHDQMDQLSLEQQRRNQERMTAGPPEPEERAPGYRAIDALRKYYPVYANPARVRTDGLRSGATLDEIEAFRESIDRGVLGDLDSHLGILPPPDISRLPAPATAPTGDATPGGEMQYNVNINIHADPDQAENARMIRREVQNAIDASMRATRP